MKQYHYRARKNATEMQEGTISAESRDEAVDRINEMGLLPVDVEELLPHAKQEARRVLNVRFLKKVGPRDISVFYSQLSRLVKSGVPILRALDIIVSQTDNMKFRLMLEMIRKNVREGIALSAAIRSAPKSFSTFDAAMIETGESVGKLDESLQQLVAHHEQQELVRSKVRAALAYPFFLLSMGLATVFIMLTFIVPRFAGFFGEMGQELPYLTRLLIDVSYWCEKSWIFVVLGFLFIWWFGKRKFRPGHGREKWDASLLRLPKIGPLIVKLEIGRVARALELLLRNGTQILRAVQIATPIVGNEAIKRDLQKCYQRLEEGGTLSDGLHQAKFCSPFFCELVSVGEESGRLDDTLGQVADWYERDVLQVIQTATQLLEPLIILVLGVILGLIIIAVLLPVFNISMVSV